ncbi:RNA-guided endonuclease InsQ/TnpB family protein [Streptomyces sp. 8N616]|uniref:RNA-guided endonuclease InsQ/TnpB family protein n=1 Tax=Streptomyces sp. 8N616 TaxID=3457414 RepID=UPI003FD1C6BC
MRTQIVPVRLNRADHARAHAACHAAALLWNSTVGWLHDQWRQGRAPRREDVRRYVTSLPAEQRPLHAHTAQAVAYDVDDAVRTARSNRKHDARMRMPWREKNYRPLSFSADYGWRVTPGGQVALSLGRTRGRLLVPLPRFTDAHGAVVEPGRWGEIRLCWIGRRWELHISYQVGHHPVPDPDGADSVVTVAMDEGIINPLTLSAPMPDGTYEVLVINGRNGRSIKRDRNKRNGRLQTKIARCKNGSRRHRKLLAAKQKMQAKTDRKLRDFDHQVTAKAAGFINRVHNAHQEAKPGRRVGLRLVVGDVRGIEQHTEKRRRASRSTRQQLSQWGRGRQERYLAYKTGLTIEHVDEAYSTQTCPKCLIRSKCSGRTFVCKNPDCAFRCHRDAVGSVNINTLAVNDGTFVPADSTFMVRVTYRRAQPGWAPAQRERHSWHLVHSTGANGRGKHGVAPRNRALPAP